MRGKIDRIPIRYSENLQNMISKLYEDYHYHNLGQTAVTILYFSFGCMTVFTSYVVKTLG